MGRVNGMGLLSFIQVDVLAVASAHPTCFFKTILPYSVSIFIPCTGQLNTGLQFRFVRQSTVRLTGTQKIVRLQFPIQSKNLHLPSYTKLGCRSDVAEWPERLTNETEAATVLGTIRASSDTAESEGRQMKQC